MIELVLLVVFDYDSLFFLFLFLFFYTLFFLINTSYDNS